MSGATYTAEPAKTGRAKCKLCKENIEKDVIKLVVSYEPKGDAAYGISSSYHLTCFKIPRKLSNGGNKCGPEEFVEDHLVMGDDLDKDEIIQKLQEAQLKTKKKKKQEEDGEDIMSRLKLAAKETEEATEPAKKKAKLKSDDEDQEFQQMLDVYRTYTKMNVSELKDLLRWNNQILGGTKGFVLFKVIDGILHGRLSVCPMCQGNLKFVDDDYEKIHCSGTYDEDIGRRIPCSYVTSRLDSKDVHRVLPFYTDEPSEEEKEEMIRIKEEKQEGEGMTKNEDNPVAQELLKEANLLKIDMSTSDGKKKAAADFLALVDGKVDLPANRNAKMEIGKLVMANQDKTPKEIMEAIFSKYSFADMKVEKTAAKEAAFEAACTNPKNAKLILAFKECSKYYFEEGNRNAGSTYVKAIAALTELEEEVTVDNAMSFSKNKTKLPGIGKKSAEKMLEFVTTGTFEKLEEKRAAHA